MSKHVVKISSDAEKPENPILQFFESRINGKNKKNKSNSKSSSESEMEFTEAYTFRTSPKYIQGTLRDYQIEGVNWLIGMHEKKINCILADEMGLGKTLQTITFLGYLKNFLKVKTPHLLIVPKSLLHNWKAEFKKFLPSFKIFTFHTPFAEIKSLEKKMQNSIFDVLLTTYEMIIAAKKVFTKMNWCYLVIDEAHRIKNEESLLSRIVRILDVEHRFLLTGTPLQNNTRELWALLNFLDPKLFKDADKFESWIQELEQVEENGIEQLRKVLQMFFLRREKRDVEKKLLPKKIINLYPKLTNMQRTLYKHILQKDLSPLLGKTNTRSRLVNILIQLRKCCNHPYLFHGLEPGPPFEEGEHLIENSGKMSYLDKLLKESKKRGSRVLIFSQMTTMLDIIEDYCNYRDYEFRRIDGTTGATERGEYIDEFNAPNSEIFIFLLSTRAGGLGINLTSADTVIMYDSDWNPQIDLQAQDRAHRIGQTKQVLVFKFISENTIEEQIIYRALKKLKLDEILVQKNQNLKDNINENELLNILAENVEKIFENENTDEKMNIEEIIKIGEERTKKLNSELEKVTLSESQSHNMEIYEFEGQDYKNKNKLKEILDVPTKNNNSIFYRTRKLVLADFQFHSKKLKDLVEKENELLEKNLELSDDEKNERDNLLEEGFNNWSKRDFSNFCKAVEIFGKNDLEKYSSIVEKNSEEIEKYNKVFWERLDELEEKDKILQQFARSQEKRERNTKIKTVLEHIFSGNCLPEIRNSIHPRSRNFNNNLDIILLRGYYKNFHEQDFLMPILKEMKKIYPFNFNVTILTIVDLKKRLKVLKYNLVKSFSFIEKKKEKE